jgi:hypothetical protein
MRSHQHVLVSTPPPSPIPPADQFTFKIEDALYPIVGDFHGSELVYTWDNQWPKGLRVFTPLDLQMAADMGCVSLRVTA